ncbi:MAG: SUMF1/EgtB/PvdO family nonheme iron enzyme [Parvularculaceae bacterium]
MSKVRLLFAPENIGFADKIANALAASGYDASTNDDPAAAALVVWSQASATSKPILSAARSALARRVLVPVALGRAPPPPSFEHLWPMDLAGWNGRPDDPRWKFVLDELELATRRGVVVRPAITANAAPSAANDRGPSPVIAAPQVETPGPLRAQGAPAHEPLFGEDRIETIRPRPNVPRAAIGAGLFIAALAGAGAAALMIGVSDGRRARPAADDPVVAFVQPLAAEPETDGVAEGAVEGAPDTATNNQTPALDVLVDANEPAAGLRDGGAAPVADAAPGTDDDALAPDDEVAQALAAIEAMAQPYDAETNDDADLIAGLAFSATGGAAAENAYFGRYFRECLECPDLAEIDPGSFLMGASASEAGGKDFERPQTRVTLTRRMAIAVRETTFDEWAACVAGGGCAARPSDAGWGRGKRPVINVSHAEAEAYAAWLSATTGSRYRLPTEAEWEYAARSGTSTPFAFEGLIDAARANYDAAKEDLAGAPGRSYGRTAPASVFAPNAFGLYDMHGNVWEWTADCWRASHDGRPADASAVGGACGSRVVKGGAWNTPASSLRPAHRDGAVAGSRRSDLGFRVVRDFN